MKTILAVLFSLVLPFLSTLAQEPETVEGTFTALGNCGMCKTRIEKALTIEGVNSVRWEKRTRRVTVEFLSPPLTLDSLQHLVAAAGHDTERFRAPDSVYAELPNCCLYRDSRKRH